MLTAGAIATQVGQGEIAWPGDLRGDGLLLPLGAPWQPLAGSVGQVVDLACQSSIDKLYGPPLLAWDSAELVPGEMALCQVEQPLRLGSRLAGVIGTLSHLARVGLATHLTSPWVLPGWDGHLTLELLNFGAATLRLHRGMPVARLLIFRTEGPPRPAIRHPYYGAGDHLGSRYADEFVRNEARR